jgi:hypothetical protein
MIIVKTSEQAIKPLVRPGDSIGLPDLSTIWPLVQSALHSIEGSDVRVEYPRLDRHLLDKNLSRTITVGPFEVRVSMYPSW